jgi:hypothetical protein
MSRTLGIGGIGAAVIAAAALIFTVAATPAGGLHAQHGSLDKQAAFHDAMRQLWEDHIVWTRQFIVSAATESGNLADIGPTTDRLLQNQADIGNALKPFYGDAAGDQVTALLRDHILKAAALVAAAKAGNDPDAVEAASAAWYQNADDIAAALNQLNPKNWPLAQMPAHM